ncbi:hypothetical protein CRN67_06280 [Campylobacter blaseri]|uniref:TMEM205-like domain-containing protein n=1 Tax=Campylobacter blaseri TaxID=2042961 RepID=A0A2P8R040_9BACT|nr:hypothetical protein CQ405_06275 [Campylobacter blaseri]PSM53651.1 hypothetical protein CRN67_06280 [Campylobacter blaseri]
MLNIYMFLLAMLIGMEISAGAFVAPVIFFPQNLIGDGVLTHFQSGQMMSAIFVKLNYVLIAVSVLAFLYETINFFKNKIENFNIRFSTFMLASINLALALLFIFYFTSYILEAQKLGEIATIQSSEFNQIHKASEWSMKIMMIAQTILFFIRFPKNKSNY